MRQYMQKDPVKIDSFGNMFTHIRLPCTGLDLLFYVAGPILELSYYLASSNLSILKL